MQLKQGTLLQGGKYKIERTLGQGGFGITYLAEQTVLDRKVAIKEFFMKDLCNRDTETSHVSVPSVGSQELVDSFRKKFIDEAKTIAAFDHPHIVRIYDIFEENGTAYYVMEYHKCGSLADILKQRSSLPEADAIRYIREVADALDRLHKNNRSHLDVKPGNILLAKNGGAVLIDFGISKHYDEKGNATSSVQSCHTDGYSPLELYVNKTAKQESNNKLSTFSPATDIYSLGATLYKLLTGITPPDADYIFEYGLPALPDSISPSVCNAIEQAMQPKRKDRPQSISAFLALLDEQPGAAAPVDVAVDEGTLLDSDADATLVDENATHIDNEIEAEVVGYSNDAANASPIATGEPTAKENEEKNSGCLWMVLLLLIAVAIAALFLLQSPEQSGTRSNDSTETAIEDRTKEDTELESENIAAIQPSTTDDKSIAIKNGKKYKCKANGVEFYMVGVEGGTFTMGATSEQGGDAQDDEKPTHQVTLDSYMIGETEVTQELWEAVMGSNPGKFKDNDQRPVEKVSWKDCDDFIKKLNAITEKEGLTFRLPTEAEWEYAARGGSKSKGYKYSGSNEIDNVAWYMDNSGRTTHPVGKKAQNELGIYDMSGNVWEWCSDWFDSDYYSSSPRNNPTGPSSGSDRVLRGGCWYDNARICRVSYRSSLSPDISGSFLGLRLVLVP